MTLVGYTNAGKSTLFNTLSKADTPVENRLFKTLDTTSRRISLAYLPEIVLSDTVGFIRSLPHELVASFQSTLADVRTADLLLHVMDITNPDWDRQRQVVETVLADIGAGNVDTIPVFNKIDRLAESGIIEALAARFPTAVFVSARQHDGIPALQEAITTAALKGKVKVTVTAANTDSALLAEIYRHGIIFGTEPGTDSMTITCALPAAVASRLGLA